MRYKKTFFLLYLHKSDNMATDLSQQIQSLSTKGYTILSNIDIPLNQPFYFGGVVLVLCKQGRGRLNIDMREYSLEENMICIVSPGSIILCTEVNDDLLFSCLFFTIDFFAEMPRIKNVSLSEKVKQCPVQLLSSQDVTDFTTYFSLIERQKQNRQLAFSDKAAKGLIYSLYSEIASIYLQQTEKEDTPSSRQNEILNQFFPLLREHSSVKREVSFYADKMCLTPKYLSTRIKKITGKSVFEWINAATIIKAKVLLKTNDKSIAQISEEMNFPNPSFFSRFFRKHTGMTPNEYRKYQ